MKMDKCDMLLSAVKTAVAQNGVDGASTRVIAKTAGVDDGHIYRFFKTRDELLLAAYMQDSKILIDSVVAEINYLHLRTKLHVPDCAKLIFHKAWTMLLSDPDFCSFAVYYYHSPNFKYAREFHKLQLDQLSESMSWLFDSIETTESCMYSLFNIIYDFAKTKLGLTVWNRSATVIIYIGKQHTHMKSQTMQQ